MSESVRSKTKYYLTPDGLRKLREEWQSLVDEARPAAIEQLRIVREFSSDLEEDNVYISAIGRQRWVERKIGEVEEILESVIVVEKKESNGEVAIGSTVRVEIAGDEDTLCIVGSYEAQPAQGKISYESPVGNALLGKKVGQVVEVETPESRSVYKILEIL